MERLGKFVVRWRLLILVSTALLVAGTGWMLPRLRIDVSSRNLLFNDPALSDSYERYQRAWGSDRYLIVAVRFRQGDLFTAERLAYLRDLTRRLSRIEGVQRAESLTSPSALTFDNRGLGVGPLVPTPVPRSAAALTRIRKHAMASPLWRRVFIDDTGAVAGINLLLVHDPDNERRVMDTARRVQGLVDAHSRPPGCELVTMGGPVLANAMHDVVRRDALVLAIVPLGLVILLLLVLLRSVSGVVLPLAAVVIAGVVTFGTMAAAGVMMNPVTVMLPCLILVIGVADVIHLLMQHREAVAAGLGPRESVVRSVARVGRPCLLTSLTTAVGFGSLVFSGIPQVREFGVAAGAGVMVAFLVSMLFVPALLSLWPGLAASRPRRPGGTRLAQVLQRLPGVLQRARWVLVAAIALVIALGALGMARLQVSSSTRRYLPADHRVRRETALVENRLMGGIPVILHVQDRRAPRPGAPTRQILREPAVLEVLAELSAELERFEWVRKIIGPTELLKELHRVRHGGGPQAYRLPTDRDEIQRYWGALQGREVLRRLVSPDFASGTVLVMCAWPHTGRVRQLLDLVQRFLARPDVKRKLGPDVVVEVTGVAPMLAVVAERMVAGQLRSFAVAVVVICLMMVVLLGSVRAGLLAMVPNILPILLTLGAMGWAGIGLNITTVMIAAVALGIAVDDTIHIMVRVRQEVDDTGSTREAVHRALASVGPAVVFTTLVLVGGFSALLLASLVPIGQFGLLVALALIAALVSDLLLTPVLLLWVKPWRSRREPRQWDTPNGLAPALGDVSTEAAELHRDALVIDLHCDTLWLMRRHYDFFARHRPPLPAAALGVHVDRPRMVEGGLDAQVFGIPTWPFRWRGQNRSARLQVETLWEAARARPQALRVVTEADELLAARADSITAGLLGIEGAHALEGDLDNLTWLARCGVRLFGLSHFTRNQASYPSMGLGRSNTRGLTPFGIEVVDRCNELGVLVDLAHSGRACFMEGLERSKAPVVVSHTGVTGAWAHARNIDDEQIRAVADTGGVIGIIYHSGYVGRRGGIESVANHILHCVDKGGDGCVALGSDFDGSILPVRGLRDVTGLPRLTHTLLKRGLSADQVRGVLGENVLRVLREVPGPRSGM